MRGRLTLFALLLAGSASAQPAEQVTVEKDRGLAGLWRMMAPKSIGISFFGPAQFGPMRLLFCRIEEQGAIRCLNGGYSLNGTVTREGDRVHVAWGTAMARFVIDGTYKDDAIAGTFTFKFSGISHDAPAPSRSTRITPGGAADAQGTALLARLQTDRSVLPRATDALGRVERVAWLGTSPDLDNTGGDDFFRVYSVEFSGGQRICAAHPDANGALNAFQCF
jgi:hypothetical protein